MVSAFNFFESSLFFTLHVHLVVLYYNNKGDDLRTFWQLRRWGIRNCYRLFTCYHSFFSP